MDFEWIEQRTISAGAGGTIGQIQFHNIATGLLNGADNFYFDYINNRVGIGSTQPKELLDVLGVSTFKGGVSIDELSVIGVTTVNALNINTAGAGEGDLFSDGGLDGIHL